METRQKRYKQTDKGKRAQNKSTSTYRFNRVKWEVWLDKELSDALDASIPDGLTRAEFLRRMLRDRLDKVSYMIDTTREGKTIEDL